MRGENQLHHCVKKGEAFLIILTIKKGRQKTVYMIAVE